jgi:hypothetical protein
MERVLYTVGSGKPNCLDLDSGAEGVLAADLAANYGLKYNWMAERGFDVLAWGQDGLECPDAIMSPATTEDWEHAPASSIPGMLANADKLVAPAVRARGVLPATWAYRTREGSMGFLQIAGIVNTPPGVKLCYKEAFYVLVPPLAPPSENAGFSQVSTQVVAAGTAIHLTSGQMATLPNFATGQNRIGASESAILAWMDQERADFAYLGGEAFFGMTLNMVTLRRNDWNNFSPELLQESLQGASTDPLVKFGDSSLMNNPLNCTYGFKSREGRLGLLQVTGFTSNPPGARIRYKLVEEGVTSKTYKP